MLLSTARPRWTISILTIPSRELYLARLLASLGDIRLPRETTIHVICNRDTPEPPFDVERRVRRMARRLPLSVHFNTQRPSIGSGRAQQLTLCKTPLVCFLDDDVSLHGDPFGVLEETLRRLPLGMVGLQSLIEDTDRRFKPRRATPHVKLHGIYFMPVHGMLVAGYRRLFTDVGGFNPRREFWGEWTELNLRMWRSGFPTGYAMQRGYLRHWEQAPDSPTRNLAGREDHVLWGLLSTALEYDATEPNRETAAFWSLVEKRYLTYAFGRDMAMRDLLSAVLRLAPRVAAEWPRIAEFQRTIQRHPFPFMPFHEFTERDVDAVLASANANIGPYRAEAWGSDVSPAVSAARWVRRQLVRA